MSNIIDMPLSSTRMGTTNRKANVYYIVCAHAVSETNDTHHELVVIIRKAISNTC